MSWIKKHKKRLLICVIVIVLILSFFNTSYTVQTNETSYDLEKPLEGIDIDLSNVNLIISGTQSPKVMIRRTTIKSKEDNLTITSNIENNILKIREFEKNKNKINTKDTLEIFLPYSTNLNNIEIKNDDGTITLNEIKSNKVNIKVKNSNIIMSNSTFGKTNIKGNNIKLENISMQYLDSVSYDFNKASILDKNTVGMDELISNNKKLNYTSDSSYFNYTNILSEKSNINFIINKDKKYTFHNSGSEIYNKNFKYNKSKNEYTNLSDDSIEYRIELNNHRINNIEVGSDNEIIL